LRRGAPSYDLLCFACQQAAEKYLKALIQELGLLPPRTHNLEHLLDMLLPHDASLGLLRRGLKGLARYAVDFRYPGANATKRQVESALRLTGRIRREIRQRLGLDPT
jgi:HEPN domain-containing protein